jgi:hypothetical protein
MRNILVPQAGHTPCVAGLPFFILTALGLFISRFLRHFTQYACMGTSFYIVNAQSVLKVYGRGKKIILRSGRVKSLRDPVKTGWISDTISAGRTLQTLSPVLFYGNFRMRAMLK